MNDDDQARELLRALFRSTDTPPPDVVPPQRRESTAESYRRMNEAVGKVVTGTEPGEVLLDADGVPIGVGPTRQVRSIFGGAAVTVDQLARVGLTPQDVPNLTIINPPTPRQEKP